MKIRREFEYKIIEKKYLARKLKCKKMHEWIRSPKSLKIMTLYYRIMSYEDATYKYGNHLIEWKRSI